MTNLRQHIRLLFPSPSPGVCSNSCPFSRLILCSPLLLLLSIFPSIRVFYNESALHIRWPKYWSFSSNISPSNEYSGLISFMTDWLDLLAVQETLKSLLQHQFESISSCAQPSLWANSYICSWLLEKNIALTIYTFVNKVMSLLFNMLSKVCHSFLSKEQAPFNFMPAVAFHSDFGAQEKKTCHCFHFCPLLFAMKWWDRMPWS